MQLQRKRRFLGNEAPKCHGSLCIGSILILHETGAYMYNDVLGKLAGYCETLVSVSVIMMAAFTTGSLSKVRSRSRKVFVFENFPKPMQLVVTAVVAFGGATVIKLVLVYFFGL